MIGQMQIHPELETSVAPEDLRKAFRLQAGADFLTRCRGTLSPFLGIEIAVTERNWETTADSGILASTDLEGIPARRAQRIVNPDNPQPLTDGHKEDPKADKTYFWSVLLGLCVRALREKDIESFSVLALVGIATNVRNRKMRTSRELSRKNELPAGESATPTNRAKTVIQLAAEQVLVSPLSKNKLVRRFGLGSLAAGTLLGWLGERAYSNTVAKQLASKETRLLPLATTQRPGNQDLTVIN
jgi:hypothetical protein